MYRAGRLVQCACDSWIVVWSSALRISSGLACGGYGSAVGTVDSVACPVSSRRENRSKCKHPLVDISV